MPNYYKQGTSINMDAKYWQARNHMNIRRPYTEADAWNSQEILQATQPNMAKSIYRS